MPHSLGFRVGVGLVRIALGVLFAYAAVAKLPDPIGFAEDVANFRMLPAGWVSPVTAMLPGLELTLGALLIVGVFVRAAALLTAGLLSVFTLALTQALSRGVDLNCGCFGTSVAEPATVWTVARDVALIAVAIVIATFDPRATLK